MLSQLGHARARSGTALDRQVIFNLLRMAGKIPTSAMSFGDMPILVRRAGSSGLSDPLIGLGFTRGGFHQTAYASALLRARQMHSASSSHGQEAGLDPAS